MAAPMESTRYPGIYRRGSRYVIRYRAGGRKRSEAVRTLDQARRLKRAREAERDRGEFFEPSRVTFETYATEWVEVYTGRGRSGFRESTREDYRRELRRWVFPFWGDRLRLSELTPRHVSQLVAHLASQKGIREKPLSDSTIRSILNPVRACLATAVEDGLIRSNPAQRVRLPHRPRLEEDGEEEVRVLPRQKAATLVALIDPRYQLMFRVLMATGLRVSELLALRWGDLHLKDPSPHLKVRRAVVRGRLHPPKTRQGKRDVPLPRDLVSELREKRVGTRWSDDDHLVFPSSSDAGTPFQPGNLRRRVLAPAATKAGVPWASFHTFRHTCASMLFQRGANAVQVQRWLGHHSPAFTLATYVHLMSHDLGEPLDLATELGAEPPNPSRY